MAIYSVLALMGWEAAESAQSLESQLSLTASGIFGEGCGVKTGEGQEVKCLQGPLGLCPSYPPCSRCSWMCKQDSPRPNQPGWDEGTVPMPLWPGAWTG